MIQETETPIIKQIRLAPKDILALSEEELAVYCEKNRGTRTMQAQQKKERVKREPIAKELKPKTMTGTIQRGMKI